MAPPKKATPPSAPQASDDDWMADGVEGDDDWMADAVEGATDEPPPASSGPAQPAPVSTAPTFYVRDAKGGFQAVSYDNALRANAAGIKVLSEAEVRALSDAAAAATAPAEPPPPPKDPGLARTLGRGLLQGFFKQGADEAAGAIAAAGPALGPGARLRMPDGTTRPAERSGDVYRAVRDMERDTEAGAREHRPVASFLSNMTGDIASDAVLSALGVPVASTPYQVASGALSGLLGSDAELSTDNVEGRDVASAAGSTAIGAGLGYVLPKVGTAVARALPGTMARLRQALESSALASTKKALTSGSRQLASKVPISDAAARVALDDSAVVPFGTTQGAFERLKELAETRGKTYADMLDELQAAGVPGPEVEALAQRFVKRGDDIWNNSSANKSAANIFKDEAANIRNLVPDGPRAAMPAPPPAPEVPPPTPAVGPAREAPVGPLPVRAAPVWTPAGAEPTKAGRPRGMPEAPPPSKPTPADAPPVAKAKNLPLSQAERIKRDLQEAAKFDKAQKTGLDKAKEEAAAYYKEAIEQAVEEGAAAFPAGSEVAGIAERFVPIKQQLGATIEARNAAKLGAAAAAHRMSGGAADVNFFDLANVSEATGKKGIPALALAMAARAWKERRPSTMANVYDVGAEAAQNLGRWAGNNPETARAASRVFSGPFGRQLAASTMAEDAVTPVEDRDAQVQRALAEYLKRRQSGN